MWFHGASVESRILDFVTPLLAYPSSGFLRWKRQRIGRCVRVWSRDSPVDIIGGHRKQLRSIRRYHFHVQPGQGNGLVAVIGDDHENWQNPQLTVVDRKNIGFVGAVVGVQTYAHLLGGMIVVRRIRLGSLRFWHHKILRRKTQYWEGENTAEQNSASSESYQSTYHSHRIIGCTRHRLLLPSAACKP